MPRRKTTITKVAPKETPKKVVYKVKTSEDVIILKHRAVIAHDGYVLVNPEEFAEVKAMGLISNE